MRSTPVSQVLLLAVLAVFASRNADSASPLDCEAVCRLSPLDETCLTCLGVPVQRLATRQLRWLNQRRGMGLGQATQQLQRRTPYNGGSADQGPPRLVRRQLQPRSPQRAPAFGSGAGAFGRLLRGLRKGRGADIKNNAQARKQDQQDATANAAADQGQEAQPVGGVGGVDPATGQVLQALPPPSDFCKQSGQSLADGTQQQGGFCSSDIQGEIPSVDKMVSSLIVDPQNNANFGVGQGFKVTVQTRNMQTGFFTVAATEYYTQPQTLNDQGLVQGHQHVTIQRLASLTEAPDANQKDFFKGLNDAAQGDGRLSVDVPAGTLNTPGVYRICSMSGSFSHQPTIMPIAQRGAQDDCIRVNVGDNAGN